MTLPPLNSPPGEAAPIHARRCVRHAEREAAARCPGCERFFCRECVAEHDGRLLCARCLAQARSAATAPAHRRGVIVMRLAGAALGAFVLWLTFAIIGSIVLRIPPRVHDGTIWSNRRDS